MLISIIIPVYSAIDYIERCIQSLICQSLENVEVILIDDNSPDESTTIVKRLINNSNYKNSFKFLKNDSNLGAAATRNIGIKTAQGDYIIFIDSDDYVSENYIQELKQLIYRSNADIIVFDYAEIRPYGTINISHKEISEQITNNPIEALFTNYLHNSLCNKLFKRNLFIEHSILLPDKLNIFEDKAICFKLFYYSKHTIYHPVTLYYYDRTHEGSITSMNPKGFIPAAIYTNNIIDDFFHNIEISNSLKDAILLNKLHVAGFILLYGDKIEIETNIPLFDKFPLKLFFKKANIPFHYKASVFLTQYHLSLLTGLLRIALHFFRANLKKMKKQE